VHYCSNASSPFLFWFFWRWMSHKLFEPWSSWSHFSYFSHFLPRTSLRRQSSYIQLPL
jgi:hypothetical protein